jgi:tetratricopeptide (TPR) repeat protein
MFFAKSFDMKFLSTVVIFLLAIGPSCSRPNHYVERGNKFFDAGKYQDAALNYRKAIQKNPKFAEAYYRLAVAEDKQGNPAAAYDALLRAVDLSPGDDRFKTALADFTLNAYLVDKRRPKVLYDLLTKLSDELLKKNPNSFDGLRVKGFLVLVDRKLEEAVEYFRKANQAKPMQPDLIEILTQTMIQTGQAQEAERLALELIQKEKSFQPIYDVLYRHYMATKRLADAEGILKAKADNNPKRAGSALQLAGHYHRLGKRDAMTGVLQRLLDHQKDFSQVHAQIGDFYASIGDTDQALRQYEEGLLSDPAQKVLYQMKMAQRLAALGKRDEAIPVLEEVIKNQPQDDVAITMRATLLLESGKPGNLDAALQAFQAQVDKRPEDAERRYNLGRAQGAKGNLELAQAQFREAIKRRPGYLPPRLALAEISLTTRNFKDLLRQIQELQSSGVDSPRMRLLRAIGLMSVERYGEARTELTRLLMEDPQFHDARLQLGLLNVAQKRFREAEDLFQKLHETDPSDLRTVEGLAEVRLRQKQFDKAVQVWNAQLKTSPNSTAVREGLARTAMRAGQYDLAIAQYQQLVAANPNSAELHSNLGEACRAKGDVNGALASFQKAKDLAPQKLYLSSVLADLQQIAGNQQQAEANYRRVLASQPDNLIASNNLAFLLAEKGGDLDEALQLAQRAQTKAPATPAFADTLGWIYLKKNMGDSALQIFNQLARKYPKHPGFRYHLAVALLQKGDKVRARTELEAALKNQPPREDEAKIKQLLGEAH